MKKYFAFLIVGLLGIISCQKEKETESLDQSKQETASVEDRDEGIPNDPTCIGGVLRFFDENHLELYTNYLVKLDEECEDESALVNNESKFNYVSLRSTFDDAESLDDPFNRDEVDMSLLNSNAEVGVGRYIVFERLGERYRVESSNVSGLQAVRNYPMKELLSNETIIHYGVEVLFSNWQRQELEGPGWPTSWPAVIEFRDACTASGSIGKPENECVTGKRKVEVTVVHVPTDDPASKDYSVIISWGDGVSETFENNSYSGDSGSSTYIHEYTSDGTYYVKVQVFGKGECAGKKLLDEMREITFKSCKQKQTEVNGVCILGDRKLEVKLWNKYTEGSYFGQPRERVKGKACTFKKINGDWKKRRVDKELGIDVVYRGDNCGIHSGETDAEYKRKKKKCIRVRAKLVGSHPLHMLGDVTSWARLANDDNCRVDLVLPVCQ